MAQPDSASDSDSDGWRFESAWVYHKKAPHMRCFLPPNASNLLLAVSLRESAGTTQKPQLILRFYRILQADLVPIANAIGAMRNNRYYVHFVLYKSAWVYQEKGKLN